MDHALLAPSALHLTVACPGSVRMRQKMPDYSDQTRADEGTAYHEVIVALKTTGEVPDAASNGVAVTDEMAQHAAEFLRGVGPTAEHEQRVYANQIHPECWGTLDATATIDGTLHIWDAKYGHRYVEVFENTQLLAYASAVYDSMQHTRIELHIYQPRCYGHPPWRTWALTPTELHNHEERIAMHCRLALSDTPPLKVGPHCVDCHARYACRAAQQAGYHVAEIANAPNPLELTPHQLGQELLMLTEAAELLKARLTGLEAQALALLKSGESVSNFELGSSQPRKRWAAPIEAIQALGEAYGAPLTTPQPVTPNQAIKLGVPAEIVNAYSETPRGELKLQKIDVSQLRKAFGKNG